MDPSTSTGALAAVERAIESLARALVGLAAAACFAIFALIVVSVFMRYALAMPLRYTEEVAGLLLAQAVFLALPWTLVANTNIRVTLLVDRLGAAGARVAWFLGQLIILGFLSVFLWKAWGITEFTLKLGLRAEVSRFVLGPWMIAMCAAFALCLVISVWQVFRPPRTRVTAI